MRSWFSLMVLGLLVAGLSACADIGNDARYQFGVSAAESGPATPAGDQSAQNLLAWKASQICTTGYQIVRQDTVKAEGGGQIVDNHLQCNRYHPLLDLMAVSWPVIF